MADKIVQLWNSEDEADGKAYPITVADAIYDTSGSQVSFVKKYVYEITTDAQGYATIYKDPTMTGVITVPKTWYIVQVYTANGELVVPTMSQLEDTIEFEFSVTEATTFRVVLIG